MSNQSFKGLSARTFQNVASFVSSKNALLTFLKVKDKAEFDNSVSITNGNLTIDNGVIYVSENTLLVSDGLTGSQGLTVGNSNIKDMTTENTFSIPTDYTPYNTTIPSGIESSYWDDWGNDIFDDWGHFYVFDVPSQQYYFPVFQQINLDDGIISTETFTAFGGRVFTFQHGYVAQGIYKFQVTVNDEDKFIFGAYGDMGSDGDTINNNQSQYVVNGKTYTLFYNYNEDDGSNTEKFYSYFIPYQQSLNQTKTYSEFVFEEDQLSIYSVPVQTGINVYFSKTNNVEDWIINDIVSSNSTVINASGNIYASGNILAKGSNLGRLKLSIMTDANYTPSITDLIDGYFVSNTLTDDRNFIIPTASAIVASIPDCAINTSFHFTINNVQGDGGNYSRNLTTVDESVVIHPSCYNVNVVENLMFSYVLLITNVTSGSEAAVILQYCNSQLF